MDRQSIADVMNLAQTWLNCILYYFHVYPRQSFNTRTVYGIKVPISNSKAVQQYIGKLFTKVQENIDHINMLELEVYKKQIESNHKEQLKGVDQKKIFRLYFESFVDESNLGYLENRIQKEIQLKRFMDQVVGSFKQNKQENEGCHNLTWKFRMEYRFEEGANKGADLVEQWIGRHSIQIPQHIIDSLKFTRLHVMATQSTL